MITTNDINSAFAEAGRAMNQALVREISKIMAMDDGELKLYIRKKELEDQLSRAKRHLADARESVDFETRSIHYLEEELKKLANGPK